MEKLNLPPQVDSMIRAMLDPKEKPHARSNYRNTLDVIRAEIEKAVLKYDEGIR